MQYNGIGIHFGSTHNAEKRDAAPHVVHAVTLIYLVNGRITAEADGRTVQMSGGDVLVLNPGSTASVLEREAGSVFQMTFDSSVTDALLNGEGIYFRCSSSGGLVLPDERSSVERLRGALRNILYNYLKNNGKPTADLISQCYGVLFDLIRDFSTDTLPSSGDVSQDRRISEITAFIQENYMNQITLSDLAKRFYLSLSHLSRLFKSVLGTGFREYLTDIRLQAAERELRETDKSIIRISNDNGFSGLGAFNKSFKEKYGETPSIYRKTAETERAGEKAAETEELSRAVASEFIREYEAQLPAEEKVIHVDVDTENARLAHKPWKDVLNFGAVSDLLNPQVQNHIVKLQGLLGFTYVRFWNLFLDNFIYFPNSIGNHLFFSKLDGVIGFLLGKGLKPFIQFGPKPRTVISSYGGGGKAASALSRSESSFVMELSDREWEETLDAIVCHFVTKFGSEEVQSWIFEMWSPCPWDAGWYEWYTEEKFAALYRVVKKYAPSALVGGCEFNAEVHNEYFGHIVREWKHLGIDPDFISYSALPYEIRRGEDGRISTVWNPTVEYTRKTVEGIRELLQDNGLGDKRLFFTMWSLTASNRNIINDTVLKGARIIETALYAMESGVDTMAYWLGTDVYGEGADAVRLLFGGAGLLNADEIMKPSLHAFIFLKKLRSRIIEVGENYAVSANQFGTYSVVYHNCLGVPLAAMLKDEASLTYGDITAPDAEEHTMRIKVRIRGVQNGVYNVRRQYVNSASGSALDEWNRLGALEILAKEDLEYISTRATPNKKFERIRAVKEVLELEITAAGNEFGVVELEYQPGLGNGALPPPTRRAL